MFLSTIFTDGASIQVHRQDTARRCPSGTYSLLQCRQLLTLALTPENPQQVLSHSAQLRLQSLHLHQQGVVLFLLHADAGSETKKTLKEPPTRCEPDA